MPDMQSDLSLATPVVPRPLLSGPVGRFGAGALCAGLAVPLLAWALVGPVPQALVLATGGYAASAILAMAVMRRNYPHEALGLCNLVTLARLALVAALTAPLVAPAAGWVVLGLAILALALDGVDGWLARREGNVSTFGARFDMEVDAAFGLILALTAWASDSVGALALVLGLPRYLFVAAARVWPAMAVPLPERFGRKLACVLQIGVLIALQAPFVAGPLAVGLVLLAGAALVWSFGRDTLWLLRGRA